MDEVLADLTEQKEAILYGTWVQRNPSNPDEACLVFRVSQGVRKRMTNKAAPYICGAIVAIDERFEHPPKGPFNMIGVAGMGQYFEPPGWNDHYAESPNDAIAVLEEAIRRRKEDL